MKIVQQKTLVGINIHLAKNNGQSIYISNRVFLNHRQSNISYEVHIS